MNKSVLIYLGDLFYDGRVLTGALRAVAGLSKLLSTQNEVILAGTFQERTRTTVSSAVHNIQFQVLEDSHSGQLEGILNLMTRRPTSLFLSCVAYNLELLYGVGERFPEVPTIYWNHSAAFDWRSLDVRSDFAPREVWVPTKSELLRAARRQSSIKGRIRIFPNPIEIGQVRVERSLAPMVAFIGRRSLAKGYDVFLRSAELLASKDSKVNFASVGMPDLSLPEATLAREWQLLAAGRLRTYSYLSTGSILDLLASSWCLVLPSRLDLQPVCVLEALSLGTPVVASRLAGLVEINRVTRCITLCRSESSLEYCDAISSVLSERETSSIIRGRRYFEQTHSLEAVRPILEGVFSCL